MTLPGLAGYYAYAGGPLPPFAGRLYEYWLHSDGLSLRAERTGLRLRLPLGAPVPVRGLALLPPYLAVGAPDAPDGRVPADLLAAVLAVARAARDPAGAPVEALAYLHWTPATASWRLTFPRQAATAGSVRPLDSGPGSPHAGALLEIHSHHALPPFWSGADDADELGGFRLYGVLGWLDRAPTLRLRVAVYGYAWEVPVESVCALPPGLAAGLWPGWGPGLPAGPGQLPAAAPPPPRRDDTWLPRWPWRRGGGVSRG